MASKVLSYDDNVFNFNVMPSINEKSKFDVQLCNLWDEAMANNCFRYSLNDVQRKKIVGKYMMIAQLNSKRFSERRTPQAATQVMMPFNQDKFNFNKINEKEVLFELERKETMDSSICDRIIINVSPIEYGHILVVPDYQACHPQVLNVHAIEVACEVMLLSTQSGFCMGFNSLCALASVNHLHLHAIYIDLKIPILSAMCDLVQETIYKTRQYLVNCYVVQLEEINISQFANSIIKVTDYLSECNIAHNLFICRRSCIRRQSSALHISCFIFPKKRSPGIKETKYLNSCCFDLAGFLLFKDEDEFNTISENEAIEVLNKYSYNDDEFETLTSSMLKMI